MGTKRIIYAKEAREAIQKGVNAVANAVKVSLGYNGRSVIIGRTITKDGYTIAKSIMLTDEVECIGADIIKRVAFKTVKEAGDNTTTSTILAQEIFNGGLEIIDAKQEGRTVNSVSVKKGIDKAVLLVVEKLKSLAQKIDINSDKLKQIATISANNDESIGKIVAEAFQKTGLEGVITIDESNTGETYLKIVEGLNFDRGYISPYFMRNQSTLACQLDNPYILISEGKISTLKQIKKILELVLRDNRSLVIIAEDIEGEALHTLITTRMKGNAPICAIKAPGFGENQKDTLRDIASVVGASIANDESGLRLDLLKLEDLGQSEKILITKDETTILGGKGEKHNIDERTNFIRKSIELSSPDNPFEKHQLEQRLAKLTGGIAVMYVGAPTDVELSELKDRYDDAIRATRCALEEGIVAGGGVALIRCIEVLNDILTLNVDEQAGIDLIKKVLESPFNQMAVNAGVEITAKKISELENNFGYNFKTDKIEDLVESGVIDPIKSIRISLINAASVSSTLLTSEAVLVQVDDPLPQMPQMR